MTTITILGAGAMGSALAAPLRRNGHEVRLWGTWLDDHLLETCARGNPHPRTKVPLADGTKLFRSEQLEDALEGAHAVLIAVASPGVAAIAEMAAPYLYKSEAVLLTTKGFLRADDGTVHLLPDLVRARLSSHEVTAPIIAVGGPCKANEVASGRPTAAVFASTELSNARYWTEIFRTPDYHPLAVTDEAGVEICAALKNVYAIALGYADGLSNHGGEPWHNLRSAVFAQAVKEMSILSARGGGDAATAYGLAGAGDLEVTALSGRNKIYGSRIGAGEQARAALEAMEAAEQTVEGVPASRLAGRYASQLDPALKSSLPLLRAIESIVQGGREPLERIMGAALPA